MIYLATSWRHPGYHMLRNMLKNEGFEVYDFKNPHTAFSWEDIDPYWKDWTPEEMVKYLDRSECEIGFDADFTALQEAEAVVLLHPSGRSAHLEAGYAVGLGKPLFILVDDGEPEVMYKMATKICTTAPELIDTLKEWKIRREKITDPVFKIGQKIKTKLGNVGFVADREWKNHGEWGYKGFTEDGLLWNWFEGELIEANKEQ